jgi:hypothetical protein
MRASPCPERKPAHWRRRIRPARRSTVHAWQAGPRVSIPSSVAGAASGSRGVPPQIPKLIETIVRAMMLGNESAARAARAAADLVITPDTAGADLIGFRRIDRIRAAGQARWLDREARRRLPAVRCADLTSGRCRTTRSARGRSRVFSMISAAGTALALSRPSSCAGRSPAVRSQDVCAMACPSQRSVSASSGVAFSRANSRRASARGCSVSGSPSARRQRPRPSSAWPCSRTWP